MPSFGYQNLCYEIIKPAEASKGKIDNLRTSFSLLLILSLPHSVAAEQQQTLLLSTLT